ncbi:unnamed protein product [Chondrus crispus]|uniref:Uncharacterized protein n=1 Tax=Chondrus crispus TaxID=2769 RepID=R7QIF8_CHOCR|nr:unnamed protein product [Chondrus crispus]CDF38307.1 unnamed protein product [Chondrus crispus]|eukprot:XP_005718192.1 unnamed protein product [Chondrus crispus]
MHQYVYVFSRQSGSDNSIVIPSSSWIQKHISARFRVFLNFQVRLSEANGRASPMPGYFQGSMVAPNQPCPSALHETWRVKMDDPHDPDTRGHYFQTWHPAWDPCFWCAYGHEHGSSPQHLMRYTPKYGYAAWKNDRESEADPGFKGFVFRVGVFNVFYMLHAQASTLRRVNEEYHTVQLVVKRADTGALMLDITQKASFGFLSARGRHDDFVPLTAYDARMQELQKAKDVPRRFRTINVVDMGHLDRRFRYQRNPMEGVYEMWMTTIQCMKHKAFGGFIVDLKAPGTGIVSAARSDVAVRLGPNGEWEGKTRFLRNVGAARSVRLDEGTFGAEFCKFSNAPNASVDGYFYTSPRADVLLDRPGKGAIRQYIDKRFFMQVRGSYEPAELGLGLHTHEARGFFGDIGYGLDPDSN